jgi:hypothetical protein
VRRLSWWLLVLVAPLALSQEARAQAGDAAAASASASPREVAPIDLTGQWVAVISEDWRWRMVTPSKGDIVSIPLNLQGQHVAESWDPAKDEAAGEQCKSYGAPALMMVPGRIHITWQDDTTLKVDTDAGTQTRLLRFSPPGSGQAPTPSEPRTWQGVSQARWLSPRPAVPLQLRPADRTADAPPIRPTGGSL